MVRPGRSVGSKTGNSAKEQPSSPHSSYAVGGHRNCGGGCKKGSPSILAPSDCTSIPRNIVQLRFFHFAFHLRLRHYHLQSHLLWLLCHPCLLIFWLLCHLDMASRILYHCLLRFSLLLCHRTSALAPWRFFLRHGTARLAREWRFFFRLLLVGRRRPCCNALRLRQVLITSVRRLWLGSYLGVRLSRLSPDSPVYVEANCELVLMKTFWPWTGWFPSHSISS